MSDYRRIATEEAFAPPELIARYRKAPRGRLRRSRIWQSVGILFRGDPARYCPCRANSGFGRTAPARHGRHRHRDADSVAHCSRRAGFRCTRSYRAGAILQRSVADAIRKHPDRFSGLAAIAPQDPAGAAKELERGVRQLGLKGAIINSHTRGEYLDDSKFWPIFEAAEHLNVPVYIHPTTPPKSMIGPFIERGLDGAIFGFAVETGLHLLRIIVNGVFDRFPKLRIVAGHLGEGLPYWLFRIDFMHRAMVKANRYASVQKLQKQPSDYVKENMWFTTSGMAWEPPILYAQSVMGVDRVLYAMDYPYQFVPGGSEGHRQPAHQRRRQKEVVPNQRRAGIFALVAHHFVQQFARAVKLAKRLRHRGRMHRDGAVGLDIVDVIADQRFDIAVENQAHNLAVAIDHRRPGIAADDVVGGDEIERRR